MTTKIEMMDEKRKKIRGGHLAGYFVFLVTWLIYAWMRIAGVEIEGLHTVVMTILILAVLFQSYFAVMHLKFERDIKKDPSIGTALNNEWVRLNELKAWRIAFFAVLGFIVFAAVLSFFVEYKDIMLVFLSVPLIGFGAYNLTIYLLDK